LNADPSAASDSVLGDAGAAGAMANGKFAETESGRSEKGGEIAVHPFEGNEETDIVAADNFQRATSVVGAVHEKGATDSVGDFGGDFFLPGIHARGADAAGEVGTVRAEEFEEGGKIGGIVLPVAVHHGGVGSGGGEQSCVEGRPLAEIFWKVENANPRFLIEKRASAIAAAVVDRDDFHARNGGPSFRKNGGDILLLVIKWDDE